MTGFKAYESTRTAILSMWSKIASAVPVSLRSTIDTSIEAITSALVKAQGELTALLSDNDYSEDHKRRKRAEIKQMLVEAYTAEIERMGQALQEEVKKLQEELAVPKPEKMDQGELLNLKADLKMLLDSMDKEKVKTRLSRELEKALDTGDKVKAWLLGASEWPSLYMESRGFIPDEWAVARENVLISRQNPKQAEARELLKLLANKQKGVAATINSVRTYANACANQM